MQAPEPTAPQDELNPIRSALLFYTMQTLGSKVSRTAFFAILAIDLVAIIGTFGEVRPNITGMIGGSAVLIAIALSFRALAVHFDQKKKTAEVPSLPSV